MCTFMIKAYASGGKGGASKAGQRRIASNMKEAGATPEQIAAAQAKAAAGGKNATAGGKNATVVSTRTRGRQATNSRTRG